MAPSITSRDVQLKDFRRVRTGSRYVIEDVDATMERAAHALRAWEGRGAPTLMASMSTAPGGKDILTADRLLNTLFDDLWMPFRTGYSQEEVDEYLDEVTEALKDWESGAPR
ncbi:DivIVA domain-containing protein [Actinomyces gaoshouyii]|uniref:DivIVA domain-containing protein n=1 Tax=Actinomyces gaoshouyii TaxID=1960083 RepID=A0A8H9H9Q1_9ACTO|nr:DivIVA domain-containing protein [Actinomyces gaoshouyii]GGO98914.1 hypothetical protein GCM10011612_14960 [Actinomyces gaoshouyii]